MVNPGWADLDRGLFSISIAAELAGLHPQTLRILALEDDLAAERALTARLHERLAGQDRQSQG